MSGLRSIFWFCIIGAVLSGCATDRARSVRATTGPADGDAPIARPAIAYQSLAEIEPRVELSKLVPATRPATPPPVESLVLYARACAALDAGRRFTAINFLEDAIKLDPNSFELHYALGRAHVAGRTSDNQSIEALERAVAIHPDHLELQTDLGRQYLAKGDAERGMAHLRLAVQTSAYQTDESGAATADLFLARALQQKGYDRAAIEQYASLLRRVQGRSISLRSDPHLAFLITDRLYVDIGDLYYRNGQFKDALEAFEPAAKRDPADFDLEARVVRALAGLKRFDEASARAADAVVRFRASKPSLDLLREVQTASGKDPQRGAADELARMLASRPSDTTLLFALVELLKEENRWDEAERHLAEQVLRSPSEFPVILRWAELRLDRGDTAGAARLLIEQLAATPALAMEIDDVWADATSPARAKRLRLAELVALDVPPAQAAAKEVALAIVAEQFNRDAIEEAAFLRAVQATPPFEPAFRRRLASVWRDAKLPEELIASASASDPVLALQLTAELQLYREDAKAAVETFAKAIDAAGDKPSPALLRMYAEALRAAGDESKFEQVLWKAVSDWPSFEDAYATLYDHYSNAKSTGQADRVLSMWLIAAPHSPSARMLQAAKLFRTGRSDAAVELIAGLVDERPHDPSVLRTAYLFYSQVGKLDTFAAILEARVKSNPGNLPAVSALADLYEEKKRPSDARPFVDAARVALADDADQLYRVAHLYTRLGDAAATEAVLAQCLAIDPVHPPASNDLGYALAERGEQLARAETLIRQAVRAEPKNPSFLDSLGWVLYKRGKFAEARPALEQAAEKGDSTDPIVLDHLGDVLYRLGDAAGAGQQWERAAAKLEAYDLNARSEYKQLNADLTRKTKQLKANEPVTVSPVIEEQPQQAKN